MFDAIAWRYDRLNHLLSLGLDRVWRRRAVRALALEDGDRILDVCTGTGDMAVEAVMKRSPSSVLGVDFAGEMLKYGLEKVRRRGLDDRIRLVRGDATRLPVPDAAYDAAMVAFGIRNVADPSAALREICRALKPGGRLVILEFGFPKIPGIRAAYKAYFTHVLPRVGRAVSRHGDAYSYLPASVADFESDAGVRRLIRSAGFEAVTSDSLTFGTVYLYSARKA
jgi:demethylmenaquinone methyltransferase/2-methoxy-6-polyprenyl-1,4-benzoquinol methylase